MQFLTRQELGRQVFESASRIQQRDLDSAAGVFGVLFAFGLVMIVVSIALALWVYQDAQRRGDNAVLWLVIVLLTGIIGLVIWLIVRPPERGPHPMAGVPYGYPNTGYGPPPGSTQSPPYGTSPYGQPGGSSYGGAPPYGSPPPGSPPPYGPPGSTPSMPNVFCPTCNAANPATSRFCAACGRQLVA